MPKKKSIFDKNNFRLKIPASLQKIVECNPPHSVYVVGGTVRNAIAGLEGSDWDICGPINGEELKLPEGAISNVIQSRLGVVQIRLDDDVYEYTPFRVEEYLSDSHTPEKIEFVDGIWDDYKRRDFACNAVYYNLSTNKLDDICSGVSDSHQHILRMVHDRVFINDGLRILRMVRIAAETGFDIESQTSKAATSNLKLLDGISAERKRVELDKILSADIRYNVEHAHIEGVAKLINFGILEYISDGFGDINKGMCECLKDIEPNLRLAVLLYFCQDPSKVLSDLKYSNAITKECKDILNATDLFVLKNFSDKHNGAMDFAIKILKPHQFRHICVENFDIIDDVLKLLKALTNLNSSDKLYNLDAQEIGWICDNISINIEIIKSENVPTSIKALDIDGNDLIKAGIEPSNIGAVLKYLWSYCIDDPSLNIKRMLKKMAKTYVKSE